VGDGSFKNRGVRVWSFKIRGVAVGAFVYRLHSPDQHIRACEFDHKPPLFIPRQKYHLIKIRPFFNFCRICDWRLWDVPHASVEAFWRGVIVSVIISKLHSGTLRANFRAFCVACGYCKLWVSWWLSRSTRAFH
jgi:hypothetical protein